MKKNIYLILLLSFIYFSNGFAQTFIGTYQVYESNGKLYHEAGANDNKIYEKEIIVKFESTADKQAITSFEQLNNLTNMGVYAGYYIYKLPNNISYITYCQNLANNSIIEYIEPSVYFEYAGDFNPNDPNIDDQYYLEILQVYEAWDITTGSEDIVVAILDTGLEFDDEEFGQDDTPIMNIFTNDPEDDWDDWDEPDNGNEYNDDGNAVYDANGNLLYECIDDWLGFDVCQGVDIVDNDVRPVSGTGFTVCQGDDDDRYHGTWVAGIVAAKTNNNEEIAGIAGGDIANNKPGISILPVKISGYIDQGSCYSFYGMTSRQAYEGLQYAYNMGADIINMSFGVFSTDDYFDSFEAYIDEIYDNGNGPLMVAAAGNSPSNVKAPARFPAVVAVGATKENDDYWPSSSYGYNLELVAPGVDIPVVNEDDVYSGTSFSAPMVCATAALMLSVNPNLTASEIRDILRSTAYKNENYQFNDYPNAWGVYGGWHERFGFGRINTYEAVCMALGFDGEVVVENNAVWDTPQVSTTDIIIEDDITLTLTSTLYMDPNAKIIVEPGGRFIVDGGTITNYPFCNGDDLKWQGIQVWGDADANQESTNGNYAQGYLELDGATIENAETAVYLGNPDDAEQNGGILKAENSDFKNNTIGVYFPEYHNMKIFSPTEQVELDNISYIRFCEFLNNEDYIEDADFETHIKLESVKGISIKQSTFNSGGRNGFGIDAIDAGFHVSGNCDNSMGCTPEEWEYSSFTGFDKAIYTRQPLSPLYSVNIYHSIFDNNQYGVYADLMNHVTNIRNSFFYVGKNTGSKEKTLCTTAYGRGIHISNSNNFHIEYNEFELATGVTITDDVIGIYAFSNPSEYDVIYGNKFTGFKLGNLADEINRANSGEDDNGLVFECNENIGNFIDFEVNGTDQYSAKIHGHQGTEYISARNLHSSNSDPNAKHWRNMGSQMINYYVHSTENNSNYKPTKIETYNNGNYFIIVPATSVNQCPDNDGSHIERTTLSPEEIEEQELVYSEAFSDYQAVETIFNDLKDGGSTEATSLTIASAQADDTWELRSNLLGMSPHLSKEVLMEAADRTDVLPNSVLLDILAANPDELKKADLIVYLENKEEPLPDYMIAILEEVSTGTTYKTALLNQMNRYNAQKKIAANTILNSLVNEEYQDFDLIRNWLDNLGGINADMKIVSTYIQEDNFADANTLLNLIPDLYDLQGDALDLFNDDKDVLQLQISLKQSNRSLKDLTSVELAVLEDLALNNSGYARSFARNVLETYYDNNTFCDCINRIENKSDFADFIFEEENNSPLLIEASPNPAKHYVEFSYELSEIDHEGIIIVTDINGKQIHSISVDQQRGVKAWDIRKIPAGSYIYTFKTKYFEKSGKLIIQ